MQKAFPSALVNRANLAVKAQSSSSNHDFLQDSPDMFGKLFHHKSADNFHGKLEDEFEHGQGIMALIARQEKTGKAERDPG